MIDKQYLIKQLEGLNNKVVSDRKWKKAQRQVLLSQWRSQVEEVPGAFQLEKEYAIFGAFRWLLKPVLMLLVLVLGSGYVGVWASENSLPGDLLYPVKITSEKIQVKLTFDEHKKTELHVELAKKRTEEIKQLKQKDTVDNKVVKETYNKVKAEVNEAKNNLQVIKDKKVSEPTKVDAVAVLTSAEKVDDALRNIDESLKNNIGGPVDDEENQLLSEALEGVESLKDNVKDVVKTTVANNPETLSNSSEASEALNKMIERESKEISAKADSLTQNQGVVSDAVIAEEGAGLLEEVIEDNETLIEGLEGVGSQENLDNMDASVTGTSTSSSSSSATAGGTATLTETKALTETSIKVEGVVLIKDEDISALLAKVDDLLKTPLISSQLTEAKLLNDQLMTMVNNLVNAGKSDKALVLLEASKKLLKAMELLLKPISAELPASTTTSLESETVKVNTVEVNSTAVSPLPASNEDEMIVNP